MTTTPQTTAARKIIFVDHAAGVVGIETAPATLRVFFQPGLGSSLDASVPEWRECTDTLAKAVAGGEYGPPRGCNSPGFWGGTTTQSIMGPLAELEAWLHRRLLVGQVVRLVDEESAAYYREPLDREWVVRPCPADEMPIHLYRRYRLRTRGFSAATYRGESPKHFGLVEARRLCFGAKDAPKPKAVYFGKGTVSVYPPAEAVARVGGSESSSVVFVDKFARPLAAYVSRCGGCDCWTEQIKTPSQSDINWAALRPLGRSATDALFGVHG